jgi:hypothetical protein
MEKPTSDNYTYPGIQNPSSTEIRRSEGNYFWAQNPWNAVQSAKVQMINIYKNRMLDEF